MKTGDKVKTPNGPGEILTQEYAKGVLSDRYLVKLEQCPDNLLIIQSNNGGLYYTGEEMEVLK